jgi:murein DD-endopeptidase MepM/ murein hydrolase activator NlpD
MISSIHTDNVASTGRFRRLGDFTRAAVAVAAATCGILAAPAIAADVGTTNPYEAVDGKNSPIAKADPQYRALFLSWKRLDRFQAQDTIAIPSQRPISVNNFSSGFGVRSDPFRGGAAMHAGVDMPAPIGTPIYATADGYVGRAGWTGGYGNLVELEHGKGIETRYGHLSAILVHPGQKVRRGDLIARMGSTGRSTGSHLHYEVRIDGHAVNPIPFLQTSDYLVQMQQRSDGVQVAVGGPDN